MEELTCQKISFLSELVQGLKKAAALYEKLELLSAFPPVAAYLKEPGPVRDFLEGLSPEGEAVVKAVIAIGQHERIFSCPSPDQFPEKMRQLLDQLLPVEKFYSEIGGIIGYHLRMLELLSEASPCAAAQANYYPAEGIDICKEDETVRGAILDGIRHLPLMAEIYPLGGAADRLRLHDEKTGMPLPAAKLPFLGKTLLEGMIADLQSREYLYYKLFKRQVTTPVAMMTSWEKDNHGHIQAICEECGWFGRPKESFRFFCQPAVPTVDKKGQWCLLGPMQLFMKPGGHGVIWRLARDEGIFDWFFSTGRKKALVRQINNPVAHTDYGILAFTGIGCAGDKSFGFASCPRQVKASEGVNVVVETVKDGGYEYALTNIEYCDFKKCGIVDQPASPSSPYSKFSSNTNILFADLQKILEAVEKCPIPGILVNLKKTTYRTENGGKREEEVARLESTMQNIADFFTERLQEPLQEGQRGGLQSYITYNERRKTISTAKREFVLGAPLLETPEGCFLDVLASARELLALCGMEVPEVNDPAAFFSQGPSFIFRFHPALGPLWSVIAQKIRGGRLAKGSELQLEIAEADLENVSIDGSLIVHADAVMGHMDEQGLLRYSECCGRCTLKNVTVRNRGIDLDMPNVYWKNEIARQEMCHIILRGAGEFYAEGVELTGDHFIEVKDGFRVTAKMEGGELVFIEERLEKPSWAWDYEVGAENRIVLKKKSLPE